MSDKQALLQKIRELGFTLIDTGMYLNAYNCTEAFEYGKSILEKYQYYLDEYTEKYGPLTSKASFALDRWQWTDDPWPWELEANC